ncbi:translation initiation factor IF-1 [Patescibacteria group bacterium]|nr:translation initiation factor IF-1 [Patescibacteria group bacterium]
MKVDAVVEEALPAASFRLRTREGKAILGHLSGKMRMYHIKILPGDHVTVEMTPYDQERGRITRRL